MGWSCEKATPPNRLMKGCPSMKTHTKLVILLLALAMSLGVLCSCKVKEETNPVIMTVDNFELTKFDFNMSYANHQYYYHYVYGAISADEFFNRVMKDLTRFAVAVNRAHKLGITLTESEEAEIMKEVQEQCDHVYEQYLERVVSSITGEEEIKAEVYRLYELDMGFSFDEYRIMYENTVRNSKMAHKLYEQVVADVTPDESLVLKYMQNQVLNQSQMSFGEFADKYKSFISDNGDVPFFVPDNCFTVNRLFLAYNNVGSDSEPEYDDSMAALKAEDIDSLLTLGISFDDFNKLILSMGDDAAMKNDTCLDWGYLVHKSLEKSYDDGFVYAAMQLSGDSFKPSNADAELPKLTYFDTTDNKQIVKFYTETGINYLMINRKFIKGNMQYERGDEVWNLAYEGAYQIECDNVYDKVYESWFAEAKITYYYDRFKDEYISGVLALPD